MPFTTAMARNLSHCSVQQSYFDSLTVDGFFPLLPREEAVGDCYSWPIIREADKPVTIAYVSSGGSVGSDPVAYGAQGEQRLSNIVYLVKTAKDLIENLGAGEHSVGEDQALAVAPLVQEEICKQLWALTPSANAPMGMVAFASQNPNGVMTPAAGTGTGLSIRDLRRMRQNVGFWGPSSPLCYVMSPEHYFELHDLAQSFGAPLQYMVHPLIGEWGPTLDGVPIVACGFIPDEGAGGNKSVYLVRVGKGEKDPEKIAGVALVTPPGGGEIKVGPFLPDSSTPDLLVSAVSMDLAFVNRSRTSVVRMEGVRPC